MPDRARSAQRHDSESRLLFGWTQPQARAEFGFTSRPSPPPAQGSPELVADGSDSHVLLIGPTGAGKGRNYLIPNLLRCTAPMIVVDVKGEAARVTARRRREMGHQVVILDPFQVATDKPASLNPLDRLIGDAETVEDEAFALATVLSDGHRSPNQPFWDDLGEAILSGLFVHTAKTPELKSRILGDVWDLIAADDFDFSLATLLDTRKNLHPFAKQQFTTFLQHEAEKVRTSVRSVAQQHMRIFASKAVQRSVAATSFDLGAVKRGAPMTVYLVIPPNKLASHSALLRLWLATLLSVIVDRVRAPPQPTIFMVDEFAQLGGLALFKEAITLLRGYSLRCCLFLQSHAQLRSLYPRDHETITENCGAIVTFGHTTMSMSRQIAEVLGDVSPDTLFSMTGDQIAVHFARQPTIIARRLDYLKDPLFHGDYDQNPRYRSDRDVEAELITQRYRETHGHRRKDRGSA